MFSLLNNAGVVVEQFVQLNLWKLKEEKRSKKTLYGIYIVSFRNW